MIPKFYHLEKNLNKKQTRIQITEITKNKPENIFKHFNEELKREENLYSGFGINHICIGACRLSSESYLLVHIELHCQDYSWRFFP